MTPYPYVGCITFDGTNKVADAAGQIYAKSDTAFTTPLQAVDTSGLAVELRSNADALLPPFFVEDHTSVVWKSGDWEFILVTSEPVPGEPGPPGVGVHDVTATGDQMKVTLSDGRELPVTLPTGPGGSDQGVSDYIKDAASKSRGTADKIYGSVVLAREFGAVGDGVTDDTAALQAGIDAAASRGVPFRIHAGTFNLTDTLRFNSKQDIGGVRGVTDLKQTTPGKAVIASRNYFDGNGGPSGQVSLHDLIIRGEPTDPLSHGIIFRDYLSQIERIIILGCGGDGLHMTYLNSSGSAYAGASMVDNRLTEVDARDCKGWGLHIGELDNNKFTDGYLDNIYVSCGVGAKGAIYMGSSGGWKLNKVHTYGQPAPIGIEMNNLNCTELNNIYVETNWSDSGIKLGRIQQSVNLDNVAVKGSATAGAKAINLASRSSAVTEAAVNIANLHITQGNDVAISGIVCDTTTIKVKTANYTTAGEFQTRITRFAGTAAGFMERVTNAILDGKVRDSKNVGTFTYNDVDVALSGRAAWSGGAAQSLTLMLPALKNFEIVHGSLAIGSVANYNGAVRARWRADLILTSKSATDAWRAYVTDTLTPFGFSVTPVVTVDKATRLLTVAFTPLDADGYGTLGMTLEYN